MTASGVHGSGSVSLLALSRTEIASSSKLSELRTSGEKTPPKLEKSSSLAEITGSSSRTSALHPGNVDLGGKGGTINKIKQFFRDQLFGSSGDRKGAALHNGRPATVLSHLKAQIATMPNAAPISITNAKGHQLDGHFFSPGKSKTDGAPDLSKPVVLLLTGSGGSAEEQGRDMASSYSLRHDVNVMSVNYRGYGASGGKPTEKGVYQDGQAMFSELIKMGFKPDQIVIHGYSMGASVAAKLHEAAEQTGTPLKGVIYDRPMTGAGEAASAHMGGGKLGAIAGGLTRWAVGKMDTAATVTNLNSQIPTLVTHDNQVLGPAAQAMGQQLQHNGHGAVGVIATNSGHMDSATMMYAARGALDGLLA